MTEYGLADLATELMADTPEVLGFDVPETASDSISKSDLLPWLMLSLRDAVDGERWDEVHALSGIVVNVLGDILGYVALSRGETDNAIIHLQGRWQTLADETNASEGIRIPSQHGTAS